MGNDILCFLPGQEEIQFVIRELKEKLPASIDLFPLYAALPMKMQQQALVPSSTRKVIVATTIAEVRSPIHVFHEYRILNRKNVDLHYHTWNWTCG